jgi:hypothetical protein
MLGFAPLASTPLGDDSAGLSTRTGAASGSIEIVGISHAGNAARGAAVSLVAIASTAAGVSASHGRSEGDLAITARGTGQIATRLVANRNLGLAGVASAGTAIGATAQAALGLAGQSACVVASQVEAQGSLTALIRVGATTSVECAAASVIGMAGAAAAQVDTQAAGDVVAVQVGVGHVAVVADGVVDAMGILQGAASAQIAVTFAANSALTLVGSSSGASLSPLFAQVSTGVSLDGLARVDADVSALASSQAGLGATATGAAPLRSAVLGAFEIAGPTETDVQILGQSGRSISLAGTTASVSDLASRATSTLAIAGRATTVAANAATIAGIVHLSGATGLRGAVVGMGTTAFDISLQTDGVVPLPAVTEALLTLDAAANAVAGAVATGADLLPLAGQSAAVTRAIAQAISTVTLASDAGGVVVSVGPAQGTINVLRALAGDAEVTGDAARQIGIGGHAAAVIALDGQVPHGALDLLAVMTAGASHFVRAEGELAFAGDAVVTIGIGARAKPSLGFAIAASAIIELTGTAASQITSKALVDLKVAVRGPAQSAFRINGAAVSATASAGQICREFALNLQARARPAVMGAGTGTLDIARSGMGTVPVIAHAARSIPIGGSGAGSAACVGNATQAELRMELATASQTRIRAEGAVAAANLGPVGEAGARVRSHGTATSRLTFTRMSLGDVAVAGAALRGIALQGDAHVRVTALVAANSNVVPGLLSTASNIIAIAFTGQAQMPQAVSAANTITTCQSPAGLLEARGTGIGYRAPPALRRSELPNTRQGGNLAPSLRSGRIV